MSAMKRWVIPGLVAIGAVSGVSLYSETSKIEGDLTDRSKGLLDTAGMDWATIEFNGRDGILSGFSPRNGAADTAIELITKEWGVRVVDDQTTLLAEQKPFIWNLKRKGDALSMNGYLPYELSKKTDQFLQDATGLSDVSSSVKAARGEPENLDEAIGLSAALLGALPAGKAMLEDNKLTIAAALEDGNEEHVALYDKLQGLIASNDLGSIELDLQINKPKAPEPEPAPAAAAPADTGEAIDGLIITRSEAGVDLKGSVPSAKLKEDLLSLARRKFGFGNVQESLQIKEGADISGLSVENFSKAANAALQAVSRLGEGKAELLDGGLKLDGGAFYDGAMAQVSKFLSSALPAGVANEANLAVITPGEALGSEECQAQLKGTLSQNSIYFDSGKASISSDSFGLLDSLIYTAHRCQEAAIQIEGHTDSDGDDAFNQSLSEKRAQAVQSYLEKAGLDAARLSAKGFGESKPVADNGTDEGKAKNRRIDFVILAQ
jgi:OOP family OmpA-OmpF porin